MITAESIFESNLPGWRNQSNEGLFFGLVFWDEAKNNQVYGVTCQVILQLNQLITLITLLKCYDCSLRSMKKVLIHMVTSQ